MDFPISARTSGHGRSCWLTALLKSQQISSLLCVLLRIDISQLLSSSKPTLISADPFGPRTVPYTPLYMRLPPKLIHYKKAAKVAVPHLVLLRCVVVSYAHGENGRCKVVYIRGRSKWPSFQSCNLDIHTLYRYTSAQNLRPNAYNRTHLRCQYRYRPRRSYPARQNPRRPCHHWLTQLCRRRKSRR